MGAPRICSLRFWQVPARSVAVPPAFAGKDFEVMSTGIRCTPGQTRVALHVYSVPSPPPDVHSFCCVAPRDELQRAARHRSCTAKAGSTTACCVEARAAVAADISVWPGRGGVTAPCGTPREELLRWRWCRWLLRRPTLWTTPRWPSSSRCRSSTGRKRRRRRGK